MKALWAIIVASHFSLLVANASAFCALPYWVLFRGGPWFVAVPLMHWQVWAVGHCCVLTDAENYCRRACGWPEIPGFIEHYLVGVARKAIKSRKDDK